LQLNLDESLDGSLDEKTKNEKDKKSLADQAKNPGSDIEKETDGRTYPQKRIGGERLLVNPENRGWGLWKRGVALFLGGETMGHEAGAIKLHKNAHIELFFNRETRIVYFDIETFLDGDFSW
jgi:hypothetical protein